MKVIGILILFLCNAALSADKWINTEGKTIVADFVRVSGQVVTLRSNGKTYEVPLESLSRASQDYAVFLQQQLNEWAAQNLDSPILTEAILADLISFNSALVEGKSFLIEGRVASVDSNTSLSRNAASTAMIELEGGTRFADGFTEEADGKRSKIKVGLGEVILLKARTFGANGYRDFTPEKTLIAEGQEVAVRCRVSRGRIEGLGLASSAELTKARIAAAAKNGGLSIEEVASLEKMKIRMEYLQAALEGDAGSARVRTVGGTSSTVYFEYSDAEKDAMRKELELLEAQLAAAAAK